MPSRARPAGTERMALAGLLSVLAGLLVAALVLPVIAGVGLLAKAGADTFDDLSTNLDPPTLPQRSVLLADDGRTVIATIFLNQDRIVVPLSDVPVVTRKAVVAIEDSRFYEHNGIDYRGVLRALVTNGQAGGVRQGGSTLTQQYVKNVLIEKADTEQGKAAATEQSLARKIREARYALALEKKWSKDQILEHYLNIANFGDGVYGIATAAQHYFSKPVQQLTLAESALLAGLVQNPVGYNPVRRPDAAKTRRDTVLARMAEVGFIPRDQATAAMAQPLSLSITETRNGCEDSIAPFYCRYVIEQAQNDPAYGATQAERVRTLFQGGLVIRTALDVRIQNDAQKALDSTVPRNDRFGTATVVVEPGTGKVKAMAVNRTFGGDAAAGQTKVNYATGGITGFQPGSTFKAFVLASALEQGIPLDTRIDAQNEYTSLVLKNPGAGYYTNDTDGESGTYDLPRATWLSVNTAYVPLEERVGVMRAADVAQRAGVTGLKDNPNLSPDLGTFTLGTLEVSPLEMAVAYATFAAHGVHCEPMVITSVRRADGSLVPGSTQPQCNQAIDPGVADAVANVLQGVVSSGTGTGAAIGRPVAGKTGTTQDFQGAWFVGFTPQLSTAVWLGDPGRPGEAKQNLRNVTIGGTYYKRVYGGGLPATIFARIMSSATDGMPVETFPAIPSRFYNGDSVRVPDVTGMSATAAAQALTDVGLGYDVPGSNGNTDLGNQIPTVRAQSPSGDRSVAKGTTVSLFTSYSRSSDSRSSDSRSSRSRGGNGRTNG